jgi:hypothetical protein
LKPRSTTNQPAKTHTHKRDRRTPLAGYATPGCEAEFSV